MASAEGFNSFAMISHSAVRLQLSSSLLEQITANPALVKHCTLYWGHWTHPLATITANSNSSSYHCLLPRVLQLSNNIFLFLDPSLHNNKLNKLTQQKLVDSKWYRSRCCGVGGPTLYSVETPGSVGMRGPAASWGHWRSLCNTALKRPRWDRGVVS